MNNLDFAVKSILTADLEGSLSLLLPPVNLLNDDVPKSRAAAREQEYYPLFSDILSE